MVTLGSAWCFRLSWTSSINFLLDCQDMEEKNGYKGKLRTLFPVNLAFIFFLWGNPSRLGQNKESDPFLSSPSLYCASGVWLCESAFPKASNLRRNEKLSYQLSSPSETVGCLRKGNFSNSCVLTSPTSTYFPCSRVAKATVGWHLGCCWMILGFYWAVNFKTWSCAPSSFEEIRNVTKE